jgi:predicted NodU family carbamoyl transferase
MRFRQRESSRPVPPVVVEVRLSKCFGEQYEAPYTIIIVSQVRLEWKAKLSVATHEGGTGRVESVRREPKSLYYDFIKRFDAKTGIRVVFNTPLNDNEPIVHTLEEAICCFQRMRIEYFEIGSFLPEK